MERIHGCEQLGRDTVEAEGRTGSVQSGPLSGGVGIPGQRGWVDVASCTSGFEKAFCCVHPLNRKEKGLGNKRHGF